MDEGWEQVGEAPEENQDAELAEITSKLLLAQRTISHLSTPLGNKDVAIAELRAGKEIAEEQRDRLHRELRVSNARIDELNDDIEELKERLGDQDGKEAEVTDDGNDN